MEKYGVVIDTEKTKTASQVGRCPSCNRELGVIWDDDGESVPCCPHCGTTEPFEKKPEEK